VYVNVQNEEKLREKITLIADERGGNGYVLIEQYFPGEEYRFFITKKGFFAALHRTPACIVGDGHQPIITLIQEENYRRMNPRKNCLCEIRLDDILFEYLEEQQLSINDILPKGKKIFLRQTSNVSKGGNCRDVTSEVHPSFRSFAKKVLASIPDLSVVGIDLLCQDHMVELREQKYVICELNQSPGLSLHEMPEHGRRRKVTIALADLVMESTL
jgi:D-alanine-D-alanine ligase-like ATP-grasp enzyme